MSEQPKPKSFTEAVKSALAQKHTALHPDAKKVSNNTKKPGAGNAPKGPPVRRAASRGG